MSTIINNPPATNVTPDDGSGTIISLILVVLTVIVLGYLFIMYGLPAIQNETAKTPNTTNVTVEIPVPVVPTPAPQE